ncbi:MAG: hypothetical protein ABI399_07300, partial [Bauldia sp.]
MRAETASHGDLGERRAGADQHRLGAPDAPLDDEAVGRAAGARLDAVENDPHRQFGFADEVGAGDLALEVLIDIAGKRGELAVRQCGAWFGGSGCQPAYRLEIGGTGEKLELDRVQGFGTPHPLAAVGDKRLDRLVLDVVLAAAAADPVDIDVVEKLAKLVRIADRYEPVAHIAGRDAHVATPRVERSGTAEKDNLVLAIVLELGAADDVAEDQANDVAIMSKFKGIRLALGNAVADAAGVARRDELVETTNRLIASRSRDDAHHRRVPPIRCGGPVPRVRPAHPTLDDDNRVKRRPTWGLSRIPAVACRIVKDRECARRVRCRVPAGFCNSGSNSPESP